jgi:uncharacterized protein
MYRSDRTVVVSPTDLVDFLACEHATMLDHGAISGGAARPVRDDEQLDLLRRLGLEHEHDYRDRLVGDGQKVVDLDAGADTRSVDGLRAASVAAAEAMARGDDVLYQAAFLDESRPELWWRGHADFVVRLPEPDGCGRHVYEPEDTKLARRAKVDAVLQLCSYAEQIERVHGAHPEHVHVVLGDLSKVTVRTADVSAYYRAAKRRFEQFVLDGARSRIYPEPVSHCGVCAWQERCEAQRLADDHLCGVSGLRSDQARKLRAAGVDTIAQLAALDPVTTAVPRLSTGTLAKVARQARLQVEARTHPHLPPPYELLEPEPGRGLQDLPPPSPGDVFFDIEGDPHVGDLGLEYLFGVVTPAADGSLRPFRSWWAHDAAAEQQMFESFVDFVVARRREHPDLHVYHYAPYETTALKKLAGRYATRVDELDDLLRGRVFVDLYRVVRQGLAVGLPSLSIKKLEVFYRPTRQEAIVDAGSSIVQYERWIESGDPQILRDIEDYNQVDCESTLLLRNWLEERRDEWASAGREPLARPTVPDPSPSDKREEALAEIAAATAALLPEGPGEPPAGAGVDWRARHLLAHLLGWHAREDKPDWWRYFDRLGSDLDELYFDTEAVSGLEYVGVVDTIKRSVVHRYHFDPDQECKLGTGKALVDPVTKHAAEQGGPSYVGPGTLVALDPLAGTLDLKRGVNSPAPHPVALIPDGPVDNGVQRAALLRLAQYTAEHGVDGPGDFRAGRDLLLSRPPRLTAGLATGTLVRPDEPASDAVVRVAADLDGGCLAVQGPPGSGKTHAAAQLILELVKNGRKVGITANSHATISHVIGQVLAKAAKAGRTVRVAQKAEAEKAYDHPDVQQVTDYPALVAALDEGTVDVVAGTAWLFSRPEFAGRFDHLVVDEAGQLSLANVLAVSGSARNLVLVGDPQQLAQPSRGVHPPGAGVSALDHLLAGHDTVPPDRGIFLDRTWRMHPSICAFVSELAYEGRLHPTDKIDLAGQRLIAPGDDVLDGSGLRWHPVAHTGNRTSSVEEAEVVADLVRRALESEWIDDEGVRRPVTPDDVLVVAPYNAHVNLVAQHLPPGVLVGTVDRFQGREAAVVIASLGASSADEVPRGLDFLYSRNRLNVAVSRARALAVVVASPELLSTRCTTVAQLTLVNGLCRYAELATSVSDQLSRALP